VSEKRGSLKATNHFGGIYIERVAKLKRLKRKVLISWQRRMVKSRNGRKSMKTIVKILCAVIVGMFLIGSIPTTGATYPPNGTVCYLTTDGITAKENINHWFYTEFDPAAATQEAEHDQEWYYENDQKGSGCYEIYFRGEQQ